MIEAAGVDTWSVCWQIGSSPAADVMGQLATESAPRSALIPGSIEDHRVGWFPSAGLLFAEGHPRAGGLGSAEDMSDAFDRLTTALLDRGIPLPKGRAGSAFDDRGQESRRPGFAGVRRLDSTVDLRFDNPVEGLAALAGVAALPLPRTKTRIIREAGGRRVETVYFHGYGGKKVLGRWYDKAVESGDGDRGSWVRPEDQRRFSAHHRLPLEAVTQSSYVRDAFVRRFEPLWRASKGVMVSGALELAVRLNEMVEAGEIKATTAKALAGHLVLDAAGVHEKVQGRSTVLGDRAKCRDLGLVLADGILDEVEVDLQEVCERMLDSEAWGAQG